MGSSRQTEVRQYECHEHEATPGWPVLMNESCNLMPEGQKVIAVVDDDPSMLKASMTLLDAYGFATETFTSAEDFLRRKSAVHVDCLLLDIHLAGMSGIELRHQLTISGSTLPVIFMTSHDDEHTRAQAMRAGCVAFLRKPYKARRLIDAINAAVL